MIRLSVTRSFAVLSIAAIIAGCSTPAVDVSNGSGVSVKVGGAGVNVGTSAPREIEFLAAKGGPARPFSPAVRANGFLILAGQIGTDSSGVVKGGIVPETKQTMENIKRLLESNGSSLDQVVKCQVFMADMKEWNTMNEVYVTYFKPERLPARSAMGASGLALNARVEIECMAAEK